MEQERDFFKEMAYVIVRAGKSEIHRVSQQAGNSVRVDVAILSPKSAGQASLLESQAGFLCCSLETNSFFKKSQSLFLRPSTDCIRPTHMKCNLVYLKSTVSKYLHSTI